MEPRKTGTPDDARLRQLSTADLLRHFADEAKLLARAEVAHARAELTEEITAAKAAGTAFGAAAVLALCGLASLFVALGLVLPIPAAAGPAVTGAVLCLAAFGAFLLGRRRVPRQPLPHTQDRLKDDVRHTKEQLQ